MQDHLFYNSMLGMTWKEVEQHAKKGAVVLFPVGVVEEHGPHLPLGTDLYIGYRQAMEVQEELRSLEIDSVIAPPFYWGGIQALTRQFPGTFTSHKETIVASLVEILESLSRAGFKKTVLFNAHGDGLHKEALQEALIKANHTLQMKTYWPVYEDDLEWQGFKGDEEYLLVMRPFPFEEMFECDREIKDSFDVHAGAFETAVMMELLPEMVRTELLGGMKPTMLHDEEIDKWQKGEKEDRDLIPEGYCGDPALSVHIKTNMKEEDRRMAHEIAEALSYKVNK